jgi:hypothetical protein
MDSEPFFPSWLRTPLGAAVISPREAAALFQHYLATLHAGARPYPRELWPALRRLELWKLPASATLH